jgi:arsenical-resistance protein 2
MATTEQSWHTAYPSPRTTTPKSISCEDLLQCLQAGQQAGNDFLLVDLRRTDFEVNAFPLYPLSQPSS